MKQNELTSFDKFKIISIQIDSGKLGSKNHMESTISNYFSNKSPLHWNTKDFFGSACRDYERFIFELYSSLTPRFSITAFVADNLRVQWRALQEIQKKFSS